MDSNLKSKIVTNNTNINTAVKDDKDKKEEPIPNSLTITINTSVPGYQTIKYKPNMTVKEIDKDENTVWFDPLVRLEQSIIDKVPENIRLIEFFNKGLFESLIRSHGSQNQITLEQAKNKIVDNNIQVTLNNLFPSNGILYINGEPYVIADIQWTKSNWKIDRKITEIPQVDVNKISDPVAYKAMIKDEINEGNKQLQQLSKDLIYGANFDKENQELSSIDREQELIDKAKADEKARLKEAAEAKAKQLEDARLKAAAEAKAKQLEDARLKAAAEAKAKQLEDARLKAVAEAKAKQLEDARLKEEEEARQRKKPVLQIDQGPPQAKPALQIENVVTPLEEVKKIEKIENIQMSEDLVPKMLVSQRSTAKIREYFENNDYYSMINTIYRYMSPNSKKYVTDIFKNTTNIEVKESSANISKAAYNFTITGVKSVNINGVTTKKQFTNGLKVISNVGGGNCLFIAVADALNYYNSKSDIDKKILYGIYGNGNNIFTTAVLRNIVSTEILKIMSTDKDFSLSILEEGKINADNLNDIFERVITTPESLQIENQKDYYNDTLSDIYISNENFFVTIQNPIENRNRPFKIINNDEVKSYIESDYYWADNKTIDILKKKLGLNIITIKNENDKFTLPYPNITIDQNDADWSKRYLFLYNTNNKHYELMTFDYLFKSKETQRFIIKKQIIFNVNEHYFTNIPPFYIIFFVFGTFYLKTLPTLDGRFLFYNFFYVLNESFQNIIKVEPRTENINKFIADIKRYFGPFNERLLTGGTNNNNSKGSQKILKKDEKHDNIQISFHIIIDMELQKGTSLSKEQISNIKCRKGWNNVRKSFAEFTGRKYVIPPVYENLSDKFNKKEESNTNNNNKTKKINGGKRRKTIKKH